MSLELQQQYQSEDSVKKGNISPSNDPHQQEEDTNELLIQGAQLAGVLGLGTAGTYGIHKYMQGRNGNVAKSSPTVPPNEGTAGAAVVSKPKGPQPPAPSGETPVNRQEAMADVVRTLTDSSTGKPLATLTSDAEPFDPNYKRPESPVSREVVRRGNSSEEVAAPSIDVKVAREKLVRDERERARYEDADNPKGPIQQFEAELDNRTGFAAKASNLALGRGGGAKGNVNEQLGLPYVAKDSTQAGTTAKARTDNAGYTIDTGDGNPRLYHAPPGLEPGQANLPQGKLLGVRAPTAAGVIHRVSPPQPSTHSVYGAPLPKGSSIGIDVEPDARLEYEGGAAKRLTDQQTSPRYNYPSRSVISGISEEAFRRNGPVGKASKGLRGFTDAARLDQSSFDLPEARWSPVMQRQGADGNIERLHLGNFSSWKAASDSIKAVEVSQALEGSSNPWKASSDWGDSRRVPGTGDRVFEGDASRNLIPLSGSPSAESFASNRDALMRHGILNGPTGAGAQAALLDFVGKRDNDAITAEAINRVRRIEGKTDDEVVSKVMRRLAESSSLGLPTTEKGRAMVREDSQSYSKDAAIDNELLVRLDQRNSPRISAIAQRNLDKADVGGEVYLMDEVGAFGDRYEDTSREEHGSLAQINARDMGQMTVSTPGAVTTDDAAFVASVGTPVGREGGLVKRVSELPQAAFMEPTETTAGGWVDARTGEHLSGGSDWIAEAAGRMPKPTSGTQGRGLEFIQQQLGDTTDSVRGAMPFAGRAAADLDDQEKKKLIDWLSMTQGASVDKDNRLIDAQDRGSISGLGSLLPKADVSRARQGFILRKFAEDIQEAYPGIEINRLSTLEDFDQIIQHAVDVNIPVQGEGKGFQQFNSDTGRMNKTPLKDRSAINVGHVLQGLPERKQWSAGEKQELATALYTLEMAHGQGTDHSVPRTPGSLMEVVGPRGRAASGISRGYAGRSQSTTLPPSVQSITEVAEKVAAQARAQGIEPSLTAQVPQRIEIAPGRVNDADEKLLAWQGVPLARAPKQEAGRAKPRATLRKAGEDLRSMGDPLAQLVGEPTIGQRADEPKPAVVTNMQSLGKSVIGPQGGKKEVTEVATGNQVMDIELHRALRDERKINPNATLEDIPIATLNAAVEKAKRVDELSVAPSERPSRITAVAPTAEPYGSQLEAAGAAQAAQREDNALSNRIMKIRRERAEDQVAGNIVANRAVVKPGQTHGEVAYTHLPNLVTKGDDTATEFNDYNEYKKALATGRRDIRFRR